MFPFGDVCQMCGKPATQFGPYNGRFCAEHGWNIELSNPLALHINGSATTTTMPWPLPTTGVPYNTPIQDQGGYVRLPFTCPCCLRQMIIERDAINRDRVTVEVLPEEETGP